MENIKSEIENLINTGATTGMAVSLGNHKKSEIVCSGYTSSDEKNAVDKTTILDLASLTKLFLSLSYFLASEGAKIDFDKTIAHYCGNKFANIKEITLNELFHFNCNLMTEKRITECDFNDALNQLYNIKQGKVEKPIYSDMPALVLGMAFKDIFGIDFGSFINKEIIERLSLKNTFWGRNEKNTDNFMNYDNEIVIKNGQLISHSQKPLVVNDKKAEILSDNGKYLCGNAGLFSTVEDMSKIGQAIINRKLLSDESLMTIATGSDENFKQRFGFLSYSKSPDEMLSEIYYKMSDNAFAMSGFTGTYLMIDPVKNCYLFIGGNKLNKRVTFTDNQDLIMNGNKIAFGNKTYFYTKNYVYMRDNLRNKCCEFLLDD